VAIIHGKAGVVAFTNGDFTEVLNWTLDATADVADATAMGDTWKAYKGGFNDWTATVECNFSASGLAALNTEQTLTLTLVAGTTVSGTALCTGYGLVTDKDDVVKQSYTFQGVAALS